MSELVKRTITGAVYVALTLGAALAGPWTTLLLFLPVCGIAARELHLLMGEERGNSNVTFVVIAVIVMTAFALVPLLSGWTEVHAWSLAFSAFVLLSWNVLRSGTPDPVAGVGSAALNILYIALPFGLITWLLKNGPHPFIGFMALLWTNDTGAYITGRTLGRTKLLPAVSPKKTVEGLIGGVLLSIGVAWLLGRYWHELSTQQWIASAVAVSTMGTVGDLLESAFKRARGVKDSGKVLPGHGGILDRFDGFLLAAPAMWLVIRLFQHGA